MRGLAAIAVILMHLSYQSGVNFAPGGNLAVDFFFALSGFILTKTYVTKFSKGLTVGQFIKHLIARLYPMFAAGCALGIVKITLQLVMHDGTAPSIRFSCHRRWQKPTDFHARPDTRTNRRLAAVKKCGSLSVLVEWPAALRSPTSQRA